jgi:hypothetical protein
MGEVDLAGWLLVGGFAAFAAGAGLPPPKIWTGSEETRMDLIARHPARWIAAAIGIGVGVVLTGAGLTVLAVALRAAGAGPLAIAGAFAFAFGGVLFAVELAFRVSVVTQVAAGRRPVPEWYAPLRSWAAAAYSAYMPLAYLAVAATGVALLRMSLVPMGLAWTTVAFGGVGGLVYVMRVPRFLWSLFDIPGLLYLVTAAIGVALLVARSPA